MSDFFSKVVGFFKNFKKNIVRYFTNTRIWVKRWVMRPEPVDDSEVMEWMSTIRSEIKAETVVNDEVLWARTYDLAKAQPVKPGMKPITKLLMKYLGKFTQNYAGQWGIVGAAFGLVVVCGIFNVVFNHNLSTKNAAPDTAYMMDGSALSESMVTKGLESSASTPSESESVYGLDKVANSTFTMVDVAAPSATAAMYAEAVRTFVISDIKANVYVLDSEKGTYTLEVYRMSGDIVTETLYCGTINSLPAAANLDAEGQKFDLTDSSGNTISEIYIK